MLSLPGELFIYQIGKYLKVNDFLHLYSTHPNINKICVPDEFWQKHLYEDYPQMIEGKSENISFKKYFKQVKLGIIQKQIHQNNTIMWYFDNKLHRENGPAIELSSGTKLWYLNGQLHRENGPAVERADGSKDWYINGELHRKDDWLCQLTQL